MKTTEDEKFLLERTQALLEQELLEEWQSDPPSDPEEFEVFYARLCASLGLSPQHEMKFKAALLGLVLTPAADVCDLAFDLGECARFVKNRERWEEQVRQDMREEPEWEETARSLQPGRI